MNDVEKRIIDISYREKIGHLSSNLNAVNIIEEIYKNKQPNEPFILSSGHAALAWYVVLEKYLGKDAEHLFHKHGVHPHRNLDDGLPCSTGSLGMGLTLATGYALADRSRRVHCLISDGECGE
jgi:transketolase